MTYIRKGTKGNKMDEKLTQYQIYELAHSAQLEAYHREMAEALGVPEPMLEITGSA
jgi:hypothetical protein